MPAKRSFLKNQPGNHCHDNQDNNACRNHSSCKVTSKHFKPCISKSFISCKVRECRTIGTDICKTTTDVHRTEGCNKWCYIKFGDHNTVESSNKCSQKNCDQNYQWNTEINSHTCKLQSQTFLDQTTGNHSCKTCHRTNRKVDSTGNDNISHTNCQDPIESNVFCYCQKRSHCKEVICCNAEEDHQDDQNNESSALQQCHCQSVV